TVHSLLLLHPPAAPCTLHSFPTRRSSDLSGAPAPRRPHGDVARRLRPHGPACEPAATTPASRRIGTAGSAGRRAARRTPPHVARSEEHTSELQSLRHLVCRLLLEKKKNTH